MTLRTSRGAAKAINFGLIYGMSAFGLAKQLNILGLAADYIDRYFARYPGVLRYMNETKAPSCRLATSKPYLVAVCIFQRLTPRRHQRRQAAERTAINAPMQGTAADIIKLAMIGARLVAGKWS